MVAVADCGGLGQRGSVAAVRSASNFCLSSAIGAKRDETAATGDPHRVVIAADLDETQRHRHTASSTTISDY